MKNRIIFTVLCGLAAVLFTFCNKKDNDNKQPMEMARLEAGQTIKREIKIGSTDRIYAEDEIVNYGTETLPVLFSVNKVYEVSDSDLEGMIFTLKKDKLDVFIENWAQVMNLPNNNATEKAIVCRHIFDYFFNLEIDLPLFVELTNNGNSISSLTSLVQKTKSQQIPSNDILYMLYREQTQIATKGTARDIKGIIEGVIDLYNVWKEFSERSQPIAEAVEGVCSFLNSNDLDCNNYSLGKYFESPDYVLSYWVSGIWHSQFTYFIEGYYQGTHPTYAGYYIPKCRIRTTWLDVKGPEFIGKGTYQFSPVINVSDNFDAPVVQANGMVQVVYGDCCCFRYFSYLNFGLNGETGYEQISFNKG